MEEIKQRPKQKNGKWFQSVYYFQDGKKIRTETLPLSELDANNILNPNDIWYPVDLQELASDIIDTLLFAPLNDYYNSSPALTIYLQKSYIKASEVPKLLGQLNQDLVEDKITLELHNLIVQRVQNIIGET